MRAERDHADVKIAPPLLLLIHLLIAFGLNWILPLNLPASPPVRWAGWALMTAGFLFAAAGLAALVRSETTFHPRESVRAVVTDGAYRFSRNPIYVGYVCVLIGLPLALGNCWGLLLSPAMIHGFNGLIIKPEEAYLEAKFGPAYSTFKARVRRWL